jgi:hypothetical protein
VDKLTQYFGHVRPLAVAQYARRIEKEIAHHLNKPGSPVNRPVARKGEKINHVDRLPIVFGAGACSTMSTWNLRYMP